ncbi:MAG: hypothetical protein JWO30_4498 [Fibrobacteres bacterium]|nr:hypothetical protein [Fibrobacterota bacterium]
MQIENEYRFHRLISGIFVSGLVLCCAVRIHAVALADRVMVLRNTNSPVSKAIADDYSARRGVTHVLNISCQDAAVSRNSETITFKGYLSSIDTPLRAYLNANPGIDFIVMTKGIPIRLRGSEDGGWNKADSQAQYHNSSLDSYVSAFGYDTAKGSIRITQVDTQSYGKNYYGVSWSNRFWNSKKHFSHAAFGGYLVTRLDAYTQAEAIGLTTKSLAADSARLAGKIPTGKILLDEAQDFGTTSVAAQPFSVIKSNPPLRDTSRILKESTWGDYNSDMQLTHDTLKVRKLPDSLNTNNTFVKNMTGLMGYISWGSNDNHYKDDTSAYHSLRFATGGIAETAVSTSARTFLQPYDGGQSLVTDLIHQGATGMKGYSDEPFLQACASPSILFGRYTAGWNLAESYYAASNEVGWEDIVIGDPMAQAYPSDSAATSIGPDASAVNPAAPVSIRQTGGSIVFTVGGAQRITHVSLVITTMRGASIRELQAEDPSGRQLVWNLGGNSGSRIQPGVYAYRLSERSGHAMHTYEGSVTVGR